MTLIYLACAWMVGIYLGSLLHTPVWVVGAAAAACAIAAFALRGHTRSQSGSICLLIVCLGLWRYGLARPALVPGPLAEHNDQGKVTFRGLVTNEPVPRDRWANLHVSVYELKADSSWMPTRGKVLVQVPSYEPYRYGDQLEVSGVLKTPPDWEGFSYRTYLARQGIHSLLRYPRIQLLARDEGNPLRAVLHRLKRRTHGVITTMLPEPEAALLTGILLGSDEGIPSTLMDKFRITGTAHIIAISGFNITIISASLVKVFSRVLQRYLALVVAAGTIALYTVLVGADPPVVRAAIMGGLSALALVVGRRSDALTSLLAAAWCMTTWHPFTLWDVGFQLSFAASLGLILYGDRLKIWAEDMLSRVTSVDSAQQVVAVLNDSFLVTLAAQITTLPLVVYHFHHFSWLSLLSNLLILSVQPAIMYLGSTAAMLGLVWLGAGRLVGWVAWLFLTYTIRMVELTANWIDASASAHTIHPMVPLAYYAVLALYTLDSTRTLIAPRAIWRWLRTGAVRKAGLATLIAALVLVWIAVGSLPDARLHVAFLDVGQGDAALIETPAGRRLLIDGGPSPATLLAALGRRLPFWDRRIDMIVLSHPHDDHLRGLLPLVERYQVQQVLVSDASRWSSAYEQWRQLLHDNRVPLLTVQHALEVSFSDGPVVQVVPPVTADDSNIDETSLVVRLSWQDASFLFSGDLEAAGLLKVGNAGWPLACTILKVPHHGSDEAVSEELLTAVNPDLTVISVGADNRFGHPGADTLAQLERAGVQVLRTDEVGTVEITTDGKQYWVHTGDRLLH